MGKFVDFDQLLIERETHSGIFATSRAQQVSAPVSGREAFSKPVLEPLKSSEASWISTSLNFSVPRDQNRILIDIPGDTTTTAVITQDGTHIYETLELNGDHDWFSFTANAGDEFSFNIATPYYRQVEFALLDDQGNLVDVSVAIYPDRQQLVYTFTTSGTYYIDVYSVNQSVSDYELSSFSLNNDIPDDASSTATITMGQTIDDTLDYRGDADWYAFTVAAGDEVRFFADTPLNDDFNPDLNWTSLEIYDSLGNLITDDYDHLYDGEALISYAFTNAGTYFVSMGSLSYAADQVGHYSLTASLVTPDLHGDDFASATPLTLDGPAIYGERNSEADTDFFSFEITEVGQEMELRFILPDNFSGNLEFSVYDSFGNHIQGRFNQQDYDGPFIDQNHILFENLGTYYVEVKPATQGQSYEIELFSKSDDVPDDATTTAVFPWQGTISGHFDSQDDLDVYHFHANQAGAVEFTMENLLPVGVVRSYWFIGIYDEFGYLIDYDYADSTTKNFVHDFAYAGDYYFAIGMTNAYFGGPKHNYTVHAQSVADDHRNTIFLTQSNLYYDTVTQATLNYKNDLDVFTFDGTAGDAIRITATTAVVDLERPSFLILSPSGREINPFNTRQAYEELEETGTYFVIAYDDWGTETGDYWLEIETAVDDYSLANPGSFNANGRAFGNFHSVTALADDGFVDRDTDYFTFEVQAGETWTIRANGGLEIIGNIQYPIFDGFLGWNFFYKDDQSFATHTFSQSGTYYIPVASDGTFGDYTLRLEQGTDDYVNDWQLYLSDYQLGYLTRDHYLADPTNPVDPVFTILPLNGTISGQMDYKTDIDVFAIVIDKATNVVFEIDNAPQVEGSFSIDVSADYLGQSMPVGGSDDISHYFANPGIYFVQVSFWESHWNPSDDHSYTLTMSTTPPDDLPGDVSTPAELTVDGAPITLSFNGDYDSDWFAVELEAGQSYRIYEDGGYGPFSSSGYVAIYDGDGNQIFTELNTGDTLNGDLRFTAHETGTYFVEAQHQNLGYHSGDLLSIETIDPISVLPAIDEIWTGYSSPTIKVYFAQDGETHTGFPALDVRMTAESIGWTTSQQTQAMQVIGQIESYIDVSFEVVEYPYEADLVLVLTDDPSYRHFFFNNVASTNPHVVGFSTTHPDWTDTSIKPGGAAGAIITAGVAESLGLTPTHVTRINTGEDYQATRMEGVFSEYDLGAWDLNQSIFTTQSSNLGWVTSPFGGPPRQLYGFNKSLGALDIAVLQQKYGSVANATGNTTYTLPQTNAGLQGWEAIWDTAGIDEIVYDGSADAVIDLRAATLVYNQGGGGYISWVDGVHAGFTIAAGVDIENGRSGAGNDRLNGNALANILIGRAGDDVIEGGDGADDLRGGAGMDTVSYATSDAAVSVILNTLTVSGGHADGDTISSFENIIGSAFGDYLAGTAFTDNYIVGGGGLDRIFGLSGNDTLIGGSVEDRIQGNIGNDVIYGHAGPDILRGDEGDDYINAGDGADRAFGGDGDDTVEGGAGADTLQGNAGYDTLSYADSNAGVTINLLASTTTGGHAAGDVISGFEALIGSDFNDSLRGNAGDNEIEGGLGDDRLFGEDGDDVLTSVSGNNIMQGNDGNDILLGGLGDDRLLGGFGEDELRGGDGDDRMRGDQQNDILYGDRGRDFANGGPGDDFIYGGFNEDNLVGAAGNDVLYGDEHNDKLNGGTGDDSLRGGAGSDRLLGLAGRDILIGGTGADIMTGGDDNDIFVFALSGDTRRNAGADHITDFEFGDRIRINSHDFIGTGAFTGSGVAEVRYESNGSGALIQIDADGDGVADGDIVIDNGTTWTFDSNGVDLWAI